MAGGEGEGEAGRGKEAAQIMSSSFSGARAPDTKAPYTNDAILSEGSTYLRLCLLEALLTLNLWLCLRTALLTQLKALLT